MKTARLALEHRNTAAGRRGDSMRISTLKGFVRLSLASLAVVALLRASTAVAQLPPGALSTVPVPKPDLTGFVRDEATAIALGKALFWDMQLGSDGIQSCGACHFHGVDGTGPRNPNARVLQVQADGSVVPVAIAISPASLASQAVPVLGSNFALACTGRTVNKVGKKMLSLTPLAKQWVDPTDSVLGPLARSRTTPGARGLTQSYVRLVQTAFDPKWWNSDKVVTFPGGIRTISAPTGAPLTTSEFTVMEQNFSLFFGLAIQLYEATLVSDDSLFDRVQLGRATLTSAQQDGLTTFAGSCGGIQCHSGPTFTAASIDSFGADVEPIERRETAAGANAFHDGGFFNIGVRPTAEDVGVG